jgi:hypothetical protein
MDAPRKKSSPAELRRAVAEGVQPRPLIPIRRHAAPLAVGAVIAAVTAGAATCATQPVPKLVLASGSPTITPDDLEIVPEPRVPPKPEPTNCIFPRPQPVAGARPLTNQPIQPFIADPAANRGEGAPIGKLGRGEGFH